MDEKQLSYLSGLSNADRRIVWWMTENLSAKERSDLFFEDQRRVVMAMASGRTLIGPMAPGHRMAKKWTFTAKRWEPISFLFRIGDEIVVSSVQATHEGRGYLRDLFAGIERAGLRVVVPSPLAHMTEILVHYGFECTEEYSVDIWRRP